MMKKLLILLVLIVSTSSFVAVVAQSRQARRQISPRARKVNEEHAAYKAAGLHAAAKVHGTFVDRRRASEMVVTDLRHLAGQSSVVAVFKIIGGRSALSDDRSAVTTNYSVEVLRSLKGRYRTGDHFALNILGGRVAFSDGTWAETQVDKFRAPLPGETLLAFLSPDYVIDAPVIRGPASHLPVLGPVFGSWGLFDVSDPNKVVSLSPGGGIARGLSTKSAESWFGEVREAVLATRDRAGR